MFMLKHASNPAPRYQTIRGAHYNPRRLTPWQGALLALCQTPATLAELAEVTRLPAPELSGLLNVFCEHALLKPIAPA